MRIGILIVFLVAGLAGSPAASAAEDTGTTQGSRPAPSDAASAMDGATAGESRSWRSCPSTRRSPG